MKAQQVPVTERTLVWRSYECFNRRDPEAVKPLYTRDCRWSFRHFFGWPEDQEYRGHDGLVRLFDDFLSAWGELCIVPTALWRTEDDLWFIHCRMSATGASSGCRWTWTCGRCARSSMPGSTWSTTTPTATRRSPRPG